MGRKKNANAFSGGSLCISVPSWGEIQNSKRREREIRAPSFEVSLCVCVSACLCVAEVDTGAASSAACLGVSPPWLLCKNNILPRSSFFYILLKTAAAGGRTGQAGASCKHSRVPSRLRWLTWILRTLWSLCLKAPFNLNVPMLYPFSDLYLTCLCSLEQACMLHCLKKKSTGQISRRENI